MTYVFVWEISLGFVFKSLFFCGVSHFTNCTNMKRNFVCCFFVFLDVLRMLCVMLWSFSGVLDWGGYENDQRTSLKLALNTNMIRIILPAVSLVRCVWQRRDSFFSPFQLVYLLVCWLYMERHLPPNPILIWLCVYLVCDYHICTLVSEYLSCEQHNFYDISQNQVNCRAKVNRIIVLIRIYWSAD